MERPDRYPLPANGPWVGEPDHVDFEHAGFQCILHRNRLGAWCGYVGVPESHPWYGKDYDEVQLKLAPDLDVHGGLTYAEHCQGNVCHPGPDKRYWIGFDCSHAFDVAPGLQGIMEKAREELPEFARKALGMDEEGKSTFLGTPVTYKDLDYVRAETERLAEQAKEAAE